MKIREMLDRLDEISRRDVLKGIGATAGSAALGTPKDASAERWWEKDPISNAWKSIMDADNFPGAYLYFDAEGKTLYVNLTQPTNFSPNNVKEKRLYYPKITSRDYTIKIGNDTPAQGQGNIFTFPLRQLGDYTGYGIQLVKNSPKYFDSINQKFIDADQVFLRLEIDNTPRTLTFTAASEISQKRQKQQQEKDRERKAWLDMVDKNFNPNFWFNIFVCADILNNQEIKKELQILQSFSKDHPMGQKMNSESEKVRQFRERTQLARPEVQEGLKEISNSIPRYLDFLTKLNRSLQ